MHDFRLVCLGVLVVVALLNGCKKDPPASLFDPNYVSGAQPTITALSPRDSALAGVTLVTITGTNFLPDTSRTLVFFNEKRATILEASTTQLRVRAPDLVKDTVMVKVAILGAELFSEPVRYKLQAAVSEFAVKPNTVEPPVGIACDNDGNVYVSILKNPTGPMVTRYNELGVRIDSAYSPAFSSSVKAYSSLKMGPGGYLYGAVNFPFVFRIPPGGGARQPWLSGVGRVYDFDFDQQMNLWAAGSNTSIYRVRPDLTVMAFPFDADVRSVRVFGAHLYLAGQTFPDSLFKVVRFPIVSADSLGPMEVYFNFSQAYPGAGLYAITFSQDGDMFAGTDSIAGSIVLVHPNRTSEKFYPGLLRGRTLLFAYGKSTELYVSRTGNTDAEKKIVRVLTQKLGAPYYGRQ